MGIMISILKYFWSFLFLLHLTLFAETNNADNLITILGTTNVHGEIDPCGWKKKPLGGLARKATILEQYNNENNFYVVDADAIIESDFNFWLFISFS